MRKNSFVALVVALLMLGAVPADAHDTTYISNTSFGRFLQPGTDLWDGQVASTFTGCLPGRAIGLYRARPGRDVRVGSDTTDANGEWLIAYEPTAGKKYYAKMRKVNLGTDGHRHLCTGYKTTPLTA